MAVLIKMQLTNKGQWGAKTAPTNSLKFGVVYGGSEENKKFFAATPSGEINFATVNHAAAAQFELGDEYYVTFESAAEYGARVDGEQNMKPASE